MGQVMHVVKVHKFFNKERSLEIWKVKQKCETWKKETRTWIKILEEPKCFLIYNYFTFYQYR